MTGAELEKFIDLRPFLNPYCHVVTENTSLSKAFRMFRELGLRHLVVVPSAIDVVGMITRKDVLRPTAESG